MGDCDYAVVFPPNHPLNNVGRQQPVIYDEILFVDINSKGNTIVGSSSITDTYWESSLFYYDSTKAANQNQSSCIHQCKSTIGVAKFFSDNKILLAEDFLPSLKLLSISDGANSSINITGSHCEELVYRISSISSWNHTAKAVCAYGRFISVWNVRNGELTLLNLYDNYHFDVVNDVDSCKTNEHIFASVSSDRRACLWDIRKDNPATIVYENEFSRLTAVAFDASDEHLNYCGSEAGDIYTVDLRKPNDFINVVHCYESYGIFKIQANNNTGKGGMLAVCGDGPEVKVFDVNKDGGLRLRYSHSSQNGAMVRDLAWSPDDVLYSCGFNQEFNEHFME